MRTHTITTKAITIVPAGILALSLAVALLAATPSSAAWAPGSTSVALTTWNCPPPSTPPTTFDQVADCIGSPAEASFNFGYRLVGTSTSQRFALGVSGDTFDPRIGVSGDYAQTNNCPPTLSAGADPQIDGCLITVTFTPTGEHKGPRPGTLTTGPGGPTMALTGNGEPRDSVPPDLKLSGPKKQSPQDDYPGRDPEVKIEVRCGDEWCTARATGRLTKVKKDELSPDGPWEITPSKPGKTRARLGLGLSAEQRERVRKALDKGKNVKAKVTVRAKDTSGNVATAKRTIKLVK
jgi:hypothetical protein